MNEWKLLLLIFNSNSVNGECLKHIDMQLHYNMIEWLNEWMNEWMKIIAVDFQFKQCEWWMLKTYDMQLHYNMNEWMNEWMIEWMFNDTPARKPIGYWVSGTR